MDDRIKRTIDRLKALDFFGKDSSENLSAICSALYGEKPEFGWTRGACEGLRDVLVGMLGEYDPADWADEYLAEQGLMRLPKDADGVPIHVGDLLDCGEHFGIQEVEGFIHGAVAFTVCDPQPARICTCPAHMTRHYHKPTVENVLTEMANEVYDDAGNAVRDRDAIVARYTAKLREVMQDE